MQFQVTSVNQTGKSLWIVTLQPLATPGLRGGQIQIQYTTAPPFAWGDLWALAQVPAAAPAPA